MNKKSIVLATALLISNAVTGYLYYNEHIHWRRGVDSCKDEIEMIVGMHKKFGIPLYGAPN